MSRSSGLGSLLESLTLVTQCIKSFEYFTRGRELVFHLHSISLFVKVSTNVMTRVGPQVNRSLSPSAVRPMPPICPGSPSSERAPGTASVRQSQPRPLLNLHSSGGCPGWRGRPCTSHAWSSSLAAHLPPLCACKAAKDLGLYPSHSCIPQSLPQRGRQGVTIDVCRRNA